MRRMEYDTNHGEIGKQRHPSNHGLGWGTKNLKKKKKETTRAVEQRRCTRARGAAWEEGKRKLVGIQQFTFLSWAEAESHAGDNITMGTVCLKPSFGFVSVFGLGMGQARSVRVNAPNKRGTGTGG